MTAINVFFRRDRAIMMTDASVYTPQGLIVGFGQKAVSMPTLRAAIACRGSQKVAAILAMEMSIAYQTYDQLLENVEGHLRAYHDLHVMELARLGSQDINIAVVGWSASNNAPAGFTFDSRADAFQEIDEYALGPLPDDDEMDRLHALRCEPEEDYKPGDFHPTRHGIPLMEAQRRMRFEINDVSGCIPIVGGHILLTEVSADGVSQRIIHRWDDEPFMPIEPAAFHAPDTGILNRRQRRALASTGRR